MSSGRMADKDPGPDSAPPAVGPLPGPRSRAGAGTEEAAGTGVPGAAGGATGAARAEGGERREGELGGSGQGAAVGNPASRTPEQWPAEHRLPENRPAENWSAEHWSPGDGKPAANEDVAEELGRPGQLTRSGPRPETWVPPRPLDDIDRSVVEILRADGRASVRSVAERVHISRGNAYNRISRLVQDGVIRGFSARVDHERAGQGSSAYITLKIVQNTWRTVREQLRELPGATHIALVSGDFDVLLLVHAADNRTLRELVLTRLQSIPEVLSTRTLLVFEEEDLDPQL